MPRGGRIGSAYEESLLEARRRGYAIGREGMQRLTRAFARAAQELAAEVASSTDPITRARAAELRRQVVAMLGALERESVNATTDAVQLTVEQVMRIHRETNIALVSQHAPSALGPVTARYDLLQTRAMAVLASRRQNAATFKTLVRRNVVDAAPALDAMLESAIGRGVSAQRLGRDVAGLLTGNDPDLPLYNLRRTDVAGFRTLRHDAMRISVSETNNALRESDAQSMQASTIVLATQWQLSGRHDYSVPCGCEMLAELDAYGYGPGFYPPGSWPLAVHPWCGCVAGKVLYRHPSEWARPKGPPPPLSTSGAAKIANQWEDKLSPLSRDRMLTTVTDALKRAS